MVRSGFGAIIAIAILSATASRSGRTSIRPGIQQYVCQSRRRSPASQRGADVSDAPPRGVERRGPRPGVLPPGSTFVQFGCGASRRRELSFMPRSGKVARNALRRLGDLQGIRAARSASPSEIVRARIIARTARRAAMRRKTVLRVDAAGWKRARRHRER
jgi:hypothetical protein